MSKLDRLSASVAKLLTEAVQEVLEVVKETVSEYQERSARTQRENDSLRRRLQELQNKIPVESTPVLRVDLPEAKGEGDADHRVSGINGSCIRLCPNSVQTLGERKHANSHDSGRELALSPCNPKSETESISAQTSADDGNRRAGEATPIKEEPIAVHVSPTACATSPDEACCSNSNSDADLGLNLAIVKRERQQTEGETPQPPPQEHLNGCLDLSRGTTEGAGAEPYGVLYVRSNMLLAKSKRAVFDGRKMKVEHIRRNDLHMCIVCGKTFSRLGNLKIHQRCHTGEKPYGCVQCGRRFIQAGDLKKHKRVHTGEKPYYCNFCGRSFSRGENLKRHKKIHMGKAAQMT